MYRIVQRFAALLATEPGRRARRAPGRLLLAVLIVAGLALAPTAGVPSVAAGQRTCFAVTGQCAENAFLAFWETHGGLELLGYPVSPVVFDANDQMVQVYERAMMEWHPTNRPEFQVQLTLLGALRLGDRSERSAAPAPCAAGCTLFDATNHTVRGVFARYWTTYGGLPVFGYPITEELSEVSPTDGHTYRVQYFERNRLEYHPEFAGSRYEVQLGLLGAEMLRDHPELLDRPAGRVPDYTTVDPGPPVQLIIPALGVNAPVVPVTVDAQNNMDSPRTAWDTAWYSPGPRPGEAGNAVIAGHVDFRGVGPAVFWSLASLSAGDVVWVVDSNGARRRFLVRQVVVYNATSAPLERVFGPTADINLNLVSCLGTFDPVSHSYDKRVVVYTQLDVAA